jgi:hypothetical protein
VSKKRDPRTFPPYEHCTYPRYSCITAKVNCTLSASCRPQKRHSFSPSLQNRIHRKTSAFYLPLCVRRQNVAPLGLLGLCSLGLKVHKNTRIQCRYIKEVLRHSKMLGVVYEQHFFSPWEPCTPPLLATAAFPPCPFNLLKAHKQSNIRHKQLFAGAGLSPVCGEFKRAPSCSGFHP